MRDTLDELSRNNLSAATLQDERGIQRGFRINTTTGCNQYYKYGQWWNVGQTATQAAKSNSITRIFESGGGVVTGDDTHARGHMFTEPLDHLDVALWIDQPLLTTSDVLHNILTTTTRVTTPLITSPAATDLNVLPPDGHQVTIGDTDTSGTARPVVIADVDYQTRAKSEQLLVETAPALAAGPSYGARLSFYPVNTTADRQFTASGIKVEFSGTSVADGKAVVGEDILRFDGSGAF